MGYLVGTDEAGYGPNLGPLVISVTVWRVPGDPCEVDLYKLLRKAVAAAPPRSPAARDRPAKQAAAACGVAAKVRSPRKVVWTDSKALYKSGEGLGALETGLLTALGLTAPRPANWRDAWRRLDPQAADSLDRQPWHLDYQSDLPVHADAEHIQSLTGHSQKTLERAGVALVAIRSRAVFPEGWNQLLDEHGNKSTVLSVLTLRLLAESLAELDDEPVAVVCDKHGGRNSYRPLLQQHVTEFLVEVYAEGQQRSVYRWGPRERRTQVVFCTKAERYLPTALASMASKYLRELAMLAFNDFWRRHVPGLKPTAGYPLDAGRFKADITAAQAALGIDDRTVWRNR